MNRFSVLIVLSLLGPSGFCHAADTPDRIFSSDAPDLSQYRVEAVTFDGSRSFSAEQLKNTFNVPVGERFNRSTLGQGLERLRQLYGDYGYLNFTVVPQLRIDKDRGTVELMISIDDGDRFTFGQLLFAGQETRAGEAHGLLNSWANLSGKRYDASLLRKWLIQNTTFLPDDGQPLRHVETHLDSSSHRADIKLTFP